LQARRNSHVIGIIHRHRGISEPPDEWYYREFIQRDHSEDFLTAMMRVPPGSRLDIVLHSIGGSFFAIQQIARAIKAYKGETTVFIPYYAKDLATLIAIAADHIVMGPSAALSSIEPVDQKLEAVFRAKGARRTSDLTLLRLHVSRNWCKEVREFVCEIAHGGGHIGQCRISHDLVSGKRSQWDPITVPIAKRLGLPVSTAVPDEVFELISACRAYPIMDEGIKTAEPVFRAQEFGRLSPVDRGWPLRGRNTQRAWQSTALTYSQRPEQSWLRDGRENEDDVSQDGVCPGNCNLAIRPLIARLELSRGSRVLCMIHRASMESDFIDTETTADVLAALQAIERNAPLDIILHTPGGLGYEGMQIARAIKAHRGRKTVFVPYFAMSAGTIISLAADAVVMSEHAALGPIDAQVPIEFLEMFVPTRAILSVVESKPKSHVHDELLQAAIECKRDIAEHHRNALELMAGTYSSMVANRIAHRLNDGNLTHGFPLTSSGARKLGLKVTNDMPLEAIEIVRAFRRSNFGQRSVLYC
jgi:ClpP class serine protease